MIPKVKDPSLSKLPTLIKELDGLVSKYVRMSAADEKGFVSCISCGVRLYWPDSDCAHFINRDNMATRFYLPNLAPACLTCNRHNPVDHLNKWEEKLGPLAGELKSMGRSLQKWTRPEILGMIEEYRVLVSQLKKKV